MALIRGTITIEWKEILKRAMFAFIVGIVSIIYPLVNSYTGMEKTLETSIDKAIPFNRYFVLPYLSWYGYVFLFLVLFSIINKRAYYRLAISLSVGMIICYTVFHFFPTTVPRPTIIQNDIYSKLIIGIYKNDNPYNCFPSVHVVNAMIVAIFVNREVKFNKLVKIISSLITALIVLSTMFIKQHVFVDVLSGIIVAYAVYIAVYSFDIIKRRFTKLEPTKQ